MGGVGFAGLNLSFYTALTLAPVNLVVVIAFMYPALVTLLSAIFLKQPITNQKIVALSLIVYGVLVTIQGLELPVVLSGWVAIVLCALVSTVLGIVTLFAGLKRIDAANAATISTVEVIVSVALAILILGETMTLPKIIGACMIISAVVILAKSEYIT